ncbi:2166_t:CDS:2 [Cetraspora pellucida]|uniref:2166_t:CDS:1 n=1 Tax=Cetraspora pellucida TaxID=1433469 RepID=A0A9N9CZC6_9GLOM|nr:2166_t:CDS:2 [Cetraspora pellucida]
MLLKGAPRPSNGKESIYMYIDIFSLISYDTVPHNKYTNVTGVSRKP